MVVLTGDGTEGAPDFAPFDAIVVSAAYPRVPSPLAAQLRAGAPGPAGRPRGRRTCRSVPEGAGRPAAGADRDGGVLRPAPRPARFPPARAVTAALRCSLALAAGSVSRPLRSGASAVPGSQQLAGNHLQMSAELSRTLVTAAGKAPYDPASPKPVPPEPALPEPAEPPPVPHPQPPPRPHPPHPPHAPPPWPPPRPWPEPPAPPPVPRPRPLPPPEPEPEPGPVAPRSLAGDGIAADLWGLGPDGAASPLGCRCPAGRSLG